MLLNNKQIKEALTKGELKIDPIDIAIQIQPSSVDLTLAPWAKKPIPNKTLDTKENLKDKYMSIAFSEYYVLDPGEFVLMRTNETVHLPEHMVGICTGRSSVGRLGIIIHATANLVDPGFKGTLTLEVKNLSNNKIKIYKNMRFCQLIIFALDSASRGYDGKYQNQQEVQESKIYYDFISSEDNNYRSLELW